MIILKIEVQLVENYSEAEIKSMLKMMSNYRHVCEKIILREIVDTIPKEPVIFE